MTGVRAGRAGEVRWAADLAGPAGPDRPACANCGLPVLACSHGGFVTWTAPGGRRAVQVDSAGWVHDCDIDGLWRRLACPGSGWDRPLVATPKRLDDGGRCKQ